MTQWPVRDMNHTLKSEVEENLNKSSSLTLLFTGISHWAVICRKHGSFQVRPAAQRSQTLDLYSSRNVIFRVLIYSAQFPYR